MKWSIILFIVIVGNVSAQNKASWLDFLNNADSIVIVSHELTSNATAAVLDSFGNEMSLPVLLVDGRINEQIIKERVKLNNKEKQQFVDFWRAPPKVNGQGNCFLPHHTIFAYKNSQLIYLTLCFQCKSYEIEAVSFQGIGIETWGKLKKFFKELGLKYEL
ncbi:MAG: hypothetical protein K1X55_13605 [Chitinophagales bacterium]|nr:hypothetical protein [Chitinophagales bacterium]